MAPPLTPTEGSARSIIHRHEEYKEQLGPHDDPFHTIQSHHPSKPRLDRLPQSPSPAATRDHAPLRPVYNDFATAHSSITSGSVNSHSKPKSKQKSPRKQNNLINHRPQLHRHISKSSRRQKKPKSTKEGLKQPTAARLSRPRAISEFDFNVSDVNFTSARPPKVDLPSRRPIKADAERPSPSPLFNSLKNALRKKSSLASKLGQSPVFSSPASIRNSIRLANVPRKAEQGPHGGQPSPISGDKLQSQLDNDALFDDPFTYKPEPNPISSRVAIVATSNEHRGTREVKNEASRYQELTAGIGSGLSQQVAPPYKQPDASAFFRGGTSLAGERSSMREGSTVDNILQEYGSNHRLWDVSLNSGEGKGEEEDDNTSSRKIGAQSQLSSRFSNHGYYNKDEHSVDKEGRMERPPQFSTAKMQEPKQPFKLIDPPGQAPRTALLHSPPLRHQRTRESSSDGICQASSYGDTKNLLNLTQSSQSVGPGKTITFEDQESYPSQMQEPNRGGLLDRNPYRHGLGKNNLLESLADADSFSTQSSLPKNESSEYVKADSIEEKLDAPRIALGRDVSHALHRASGFSYPSQETADPHKGDGGLQSSTDSSGFLDFTRKQGAVPCEARKPNAKGFYHESAIHQTWLGSQQMGRVRIPVNYRGSLSSSIRFSVSASLAEDGFNGLNLGQHDEDANDWETLPETGMTSQAVTNLQEMMGRINQAGSSVANTSDDGEVSPELYLHEDFSSTDRIIQHPANIDYSLDYRQREIKGENFTVLLPCYQQHTVNGFPANSSRSLSPFQQSPGDFYYQQAPPLSTNHTNPFQYPPPESMDVSKQPDDAPKNKKHSATSSSQVPYRDRDILDRWINGFGAPQPERKITKVSDPVQVVDSSRIYKSVAQAIPQPYRGSISDASFSTVSPITGGHGQRDQEINAGMLGVAVTNGHEGVTREKTPDVKRPPGAFYQGLRSTTNPRPKRLSMNHPTSARHSQKLPSKYLTNQIRPLSLLRAHPPLVGIEKAEGDLGRKGEDEFLYRSPLAPVKSRSWRNLYTREQLSMIRSAAKDDGMCDIESQQSQSSRPKLHEHFKANGSWKRLPWSPQMLAWPRDNSSIQTDLASRKTMISTLVFAFCCLFPPALVLYGFGHMDNIMLWITDGEICSFRRSHKKSALLVVGFVVIVSVIAIPVAIVAKAPRQA